LIRGSAQLLQPLPDEMSDARQTTLIDAFVVLQRREYGIASLQERCESGVTIGSESADRIIIVTVMRRGTERTGNHLGCCHCSPGPAGENGRFESIECDVGEMNMSSPDCQTPGKGDTRNNSVGRFGNAHASSRNATAIGVT
jgi:hypothetical protein